LSLDALGAANDGRRDFKVSYDILFVTPAPSPSMWYGRAPDPYFVLHGKGEHDGTILTIASAEFGRLQLDAVQVAKQRPDYQPPVRSLLKGESKNSPQEVAAVSRCGTQFAIVDRRDQGARQRASAGRSSCTCCPTAARIAAIGKSARSRASRAKPQDQSHRRARAGNGPISARRKGTKERAGNILQLIAAVKFGHNIGEALKWARSWLRARQPRS
jgi:hypothetical protein